MGLNNLKTNKELLTLIKKGDRVAFYHIYEKYCRRLYAFVFKYIKQEEDAEEIVQEVFVKIWESRSKISLHTSFESFLFTISYNATMSLLRKRVNEKKYIEHLKFSQQNIENNDVTNKIHYDELNAKLKDLLNELTPRQREIFKLNREEGLSHKEIAEKLNVSVNTVKKHMVNTLSFLKKHIGNDHIISVFYFYLFVL